MYKVFVNDIPIILSTEKDYDDKYLSLPIKKAKLKKLIKRINNGDIFYVNLYHKKEEKLLKHLYKKLPVVVAGGGMVLNEKDEVLFIHRNGRWDLPKGKVEKKESLEEGAIREVEEETGVKDLEITRFLDRTYHIFQRKGEYRLKVTYWYEMRTDYQGELIPEEKEGIMKVKWKSPDKVRKSLENSYANIRLLFTDKGLPVYPENQVS